MKTRVLQITPGMGVGGIPSVIRALCDYADGDRYEHTVLCLNYVGDTGDAMAAEGYRVDSLPERGRSPYLAFLTVAEYLRENRFDIVHTHNTQACMDGIPAAALSRVPLVIHTDHARLYPDKRRYIMAERLLFPVAHRVVGVSEHTTGCIRQHHGLSESRLVTIPNGIDGTRFEGERTKAVIRELGFEGSGPFLGVACRLVEQKALHNMIEALPAVREAFPDAQFLISGEGPLREMLERTAAERGVADAVHFLGVRHDMDRFLAALDVFVLPSDWEGLPMVVLEAMAAGCPIVASAVGGVPTAVRDGENGFTVPPADPAALARALLRLLGDEGLQASFSTETRRLFNERFTASAMASGYEELYARAGGRL